VASRVAGAGRCVDGVREGDALPVPFDHLVIDPGTALLLPADANFALPSLGGFVGLPLFFQAVAFDTTYPATAAYALHLDG
jgi:hypothetical protein